ncbi:MAG: exo-beta-1,3-glucanase [Methylovulum sp.]|nr:exo-beta-1,3-glucanase [Methylovulum sp.]
MQISPGQLLLPVVVLLWLITSQNTFADKEITVPQPKETATALQCVAFSPYVGQLTPDYGAQPSKALIDKLLDKLVKDTRFRCIMTYGVINGLEYTFAAAKARDIKVIAILWIDKDIAVNSQSITAGIQAAKAYPGTIIKLSCGSEVRTRHGYVFDGEITRCIQALREAKVTQPITTIDTWWEWCNRSLTCGQTSFSAQVDWIGINIFPWWENRFSGIHTCTTAEQAADFHIARLGEVHSVNPDKEIMVTEFGWPNGPKNGTAINIKTGQHCGVASLKNQAIVVQNTFKKLAKENWSGSVFEAFSEDWKPSSEGDSGRFWGICQGEAPYTCNQEINSTDK